jgi:hypothetical protein
MNRKTIIIIIIILVVCCCLFSLVAGGLAGFLAFTNQKAVATLEVFTPTPVASETPLSPTWTATLPPTKPPDATATPLSEPTSSPQPAPGQGGMGITRQEIIQFFNSGNAFVFEAPFDSAGYETVLGNHKTLCLKGDCAAVSLLGPANNLLAISVAVPTDPKDKNQTVTALTLLMTTAVHFTGQGSPYPNQLLNDILKAQAAQKDLDQKTTINGYIMIESYNSKTHIASLAIAK